ncbi:pyocin activator PrtN family protein [Burkholderia sp. Ed8]|uniref:pyocin activator PrtN family protein n=1 Tax=Burkholderia sp. Ed8 TaxID=3112957 RepID=UPI00345D8194
MNTAFLLMAQYGATAIVSVELVCRDYFSHLTVAQFVRKVNAGEIAIPLVRMERSQKSAKGVHIQDLAIYIDERRSAALKECAQLRA